MLDDYNTGVHHNTACGKTSTTFISDSNSVLTTPGTGSKVSLDPSLTKRNEKKNKEYEEKKRRRGVKTKKEIIKDSIFLVPHTMTFSYILLLLRGGIAQCVPCTATISDLLCVPIIIPVSHVRLYGMLKNPTSMKRYFVGKIHSHFSQFLQLRYKMSLLVIARKFSRPKESIRGSA
jgi:hypothetical protein